MQTLLQLGHARIHDLNQAFASRNPHTNGKTNGAQEAGNQPITSGDDLLIVLGRLIQADIIETVKPGSFQNPDDVYHEIRDSVTKTGPGEANAKIKSEHEEQIFRKWREFRDHGKSIKRLLDQSRGSAAKRRRLHNGGSNGYYRDEESVPKLDVCCSSVLLIWTR